MLHDLPAEWRLDFRKATVEADFARLQSMVEAIRASSPDTARALSDLLNGFEYARIQALLGPAE
jgi:hypothetical protein